MACTIDEDFSKDEFLIAFISEQDEQNYQTLVKYAQNNWRRIIREEVFGKVNGGQGFTYYEQQKKN